MAGENEVELLTVKFYNLHIVSVKNVLLLLLYVNWHLTMSEHVSTVADEPRHALRHGLCVVNKNGRSV